MGTKETTEMPDDIDPVEAFALINREETDEPVAELTPATDEPAPATDEITNASQKEDENPTPDEPQNEDIWAQASDSQRTAFQQLQHVTADLEHRRRSDDGRVSALQKQINSLTEKLEAKPSPEPAPSDDAATTGLTPEQLKEFNEDYGDIASFINAQVQEQIKDRMAPLNQQMSQFEQTQQLSESRQQEEVFSTELKRLASAHPDYQSIQAGNEFWDWLDTKPKFMQAAVKSSSASDNIELLNQFKSETTRSSTPTPAPAAMDLSAHAELPSQGAAKIPAEEPVDEIEYFNLIAGN